MAAEKIKILYVDDEDYNLIAFRANFRKQYDVYTATNAHEGLDLLQKNVAHIIISDQRMPHITGIEFLEKAAALYPDSIRLLITAYSDIDVVIKAINLGQVSKFIQKPWDWEKLTIAIDHCVTLYTSRLAMKLKNAELQKANEELTKFVYSVSHDLRAPLASILGVVNVTKLMPELRVADSYFKMIEGRVERLDEFIRKILDYYKNARAQQEAKDKINFEKLLSDVWNTLKSQDSTIHFELVVNQQNAFISDRLRFQIIFENLISNAVKYQNPSSSTPFIKVNVDVNHQETIIMVSDNGIGIDEAYTADIFKLFFRADDTLNKEGSGIGLYIVKEAVDKMGGVITVSSSKQEGTTFKLVIPTKH